MSGPWRSRSFRSLRQPAGSRAPVLGVGWRVLVTTGASALPSVGLMDAMGNAVGSVADGAEVEILAWRPGRSVDPRYRVRSVSDRAEGWIEAANLAQKQSSLVPPKADTTSAPAGRTGKR